MMPSMTHKARQTEFKPAGWYGAFSEGESSEDDGAVGTAHISENPFVIVHDGWNPSHGGPRPPGLPAATFHESPSAGGTEAWQTHYPAISSGVGTANGFQPNGAWFRGSGGSWEQAYKTGFGSEGRGKPAEWFDNQVGQRDGYGRMYEPYAGSGRRYVLWQERAVNTSLTCESYGCVANATLQAFDGTTEQAARCRFSFGVHPTNYAKPTEKIEWIFINGAQVNTDCLPMKDGCSVDGVDGHPLHTCVSGLDIMPLVPWTGTLQIAAKISDAVDECPYEGNLLSAVPVVTCMVKPLDPSPLYGGALNSPKSEYDTGAMNASTGIAGDGPSWLNPHMNASGTPAYPLEILSIWQANGTDIINSDGVLSSMIGSNHWRAVAPLNCLEPGCTASVSIEINDAAKTGKCSLTVVNNMTDFDNSESSEIIEYVGINLRNLTTASIAPGKNPCLAKEVGEPLAPTDMLYTLLQDVDISSDTSSGTVQIEAKISDHVDDCTSNGYLFNNIAQIDCVMPSQVAPI
jgi:hypothetical protein